MNRETQKILSLILQQPSAQVEFSIIIEIKGFFLVVNVRRFSLVIILTDFVDDMRILCSGSATLLHITNNDVMETKILSFV